MGSGEVHCLGRVPVATLRPISPFLHATPRTLSLRPARMPPQSYRLLRITNAWKEVIDPASAKPYYWNTSTNETTWEKPPTIEHAQNEEITYEQLINVLLNANTERFGDVANQYRSMCFDDEFFDYLASEIDRAKDPNQREKIEKLRARLSNPLLKNPPPYL